MKKRIIALTAVAATVAVPTVVAASSASAAVDREKRGSCGAGTYELSVESEDGGYEVNVDVDRVAPGTKWRVVVKQDGRVKADVVRTAEPDGDVDLETWLPNTKGKDTIRFKATRVGTKTSCASSITVA